MDLQLRMCEAVISEDLDTITHIAEICRISKYNPDKTRKTKADLKIEIPVQIKFLWDSDYFQKSGIRDICVLMRMEALYARHKSRQERGARSLSDSTVGRREMARVTEDDVELAERYAAALQTIQSLFTVDNWGEDDVELAERYLATLEKIEAKKAAALAGQATGEGGSA